MDKNGDNLPSRETGAIPKKLPEGKHKHPAPQDPASDPSDPHGSKDTGDNQRSAEDGHDATKESPTKKRRTRADANTGAPHPALHGDDDGDYEDIAIGRAPLAREEYSQVDLTVSKSLDDMKTAALKAATEAERAGEQADDAEGEVQGAQGWAPQGGVDVAQGGALGGGQFGVDGELLAALPGVGIARDSTADSGLGVSNMDLAGAAAAAPLPHGGGARAKRHGPQNPGLSLSPRKSSDKCSPRRTSPRGANASEQLTEEYGNHDPTCGIYGILSSHHSSSSASERAATVPRTYQSPTMHNTAAGLSSSSQHIPQQPFVGFPQGVNPIDAYDHPQCTCGLKERIAKSMKSITTFRHNKISPAMIDDTDDDATRDNVPQRAQQQPDDAPDSDDGDSGAED